jgi:outer membrane protein assembly factor BamB
MKKFILAAALLAASTAHAGHSCTVYSQDHKTVLGNVTVTQKWIYLNIAGVKYGNALNSPLFFTKDGTTYVEWPGKTAYSLTAQGDTVVTKNHGVVIGLAGPLAGTGYTAREGSARSDYLPVAECVQQPE